MRLVRGALRYCKYNLFCIPIVGHVSDGEALIEKGLPAEEEGDPRDSIRIQVFYHGILDIPNLIHVWTGDAQFDICQIYGR